MGNVARLLRDRERRARPKRAPTWEILWLPATFVVFLAGAALLPRTESRWTNALLWACYGEAWMVVVVATTRFLRFLRRRRAHGPASGGRVREPPLAVRFPGYFTVYLVAEQLRPRWASTEATFVVMGALIVLAEAVLAIRWRRHEAERRQQEMAHLAEQF
jgi:predicted benzoate:H+ symporter BenE